MFFQAIMADTVAEFSFCAVVFLFIELHPPNFMRQFG